MTKINNISRITKDIIKNIQVDLRDFINFHGNYVEFVNSKDLRVEIHFVENYYILSKSFDVCFSDYKIIDDKIILLKNNRTIGNVYL